MTTKLDNRVQALTREGDIEGAVEQIVDWIDGTDLRDIPINAENMDSMPLGSVVCVDGGYWYKVVYSEITGDLCWERNGKKYLNAGSVVLGAKTIQLIRWGTSVNL